MTPTGPVFVVADLASVSIEQVKKPKLVLASPAPTPKRRPRRKK